MKRVLLFIGTDLAIMFVLAMSASLLGVNRYLTANGLNLGTLLVFSGLMGFGGAFISLWNRKGDVSARTLNAYLHRQPSARSACSAARHAVVAGTMLQNHAPVVAG